MTVRLFGHEVKDYPGFPILPFTWAEVGAKFDKLKGDRADDGLRKDINVLKLRVFSRVLRRECLSAPVACPLPPSPPVCSRREGYSIR
jgi:hypothetical protein